jgi:eukaryotic-like serine/threonine-protein kinase
MRVTTRIYKGEELPPAPAFSVCLERFQGLARMSNESPSQNWARLKTLFAELLPLSADERSARIHVECGDDAWLRNELISLLSSHEDSAALLDTPLEARATAMFRPGSSEVDPTLPAQIGPYRPLRLLGSGGMGAVYLAERSDGAFTQCVALKLIHGGFTHVEARARFLRERRILAGLRHPGIAQLFDGGVSEQGLPYFTMEWVEGEPITNWCDAQALDVASRVDLFLRVLDAVAYAHRHLVVHRDIKPANLLVTARGEPKLLDFGIAKLLDGSEDATQTSHSRPFTPSYAAPEQLFNEAITTATDVYALGALLYELLSGRAPRRLRLHQGVVADSSEFERAPPRLSVALAESQSGNVDSARAEALAARQRHLQSGDLDQIVRIALQRQPDQRYPGVDAMADDLRAWRAHRPLLSRPTPWTLRARKYLRRHWRALGAAAALLMAIGAGLAGSLYQARQAEREARTSAEVRRVLTDLFSAADPNVAQGRDISVRQLLDQGRHRVMNELSESPEVRAQLLYDMGRIYRSLGEDRIAVEIFDAALPGLPTDADRSRLLTERALSLDMMRELDRAKADAEQALRLAPALDDAHVAAVVALATIELSLDQFDAGAARLQLLREVLTDSAQSAERDQHLSQVTTQLAMLRAQQGRWDEAEKLMREGIALSDAQPNDPDRGVEQVNLGEILQKLSRNDEAEAALRLGIAQHTRILGPTHPLTLGARKELALVLIQQRRFDEGDREYRETIDLYKATLGEQHPATGLALHNYAVAQYNRSNYAEAETLIRAALAIAERDLLPTHERVAVARLVLAASMLETGKLDAAVPMLEEYLRVMRERGVANTLPSALNTLAIAYIKQGRTQEALKLNAECLQIEAGLPGFLPKNSFWTRVIAARAHFVAGRVEQAARMQTEVLAEWREAFGSDLGPRAAALMVELATSLSALHRDVPQARALLEEAIAIRSAKMGATHALTLEAQAQLAAM